MQVTYNSELTERIAIGTGTEVSHDYTQIDATPVLVEYAEFMIAAAIGPNDDDDPAGSGGETTSHFYATPVRYESTFTQPMMSAQDDDDDSQQGEDPAHHNGDPAGYGSESTDASEHSSNGS